METNLFGETFTLDDRAMERIQLYFSKYIKDDESLSDDDVVAAIDLLSKTSIDRLYTEYNMNYMFLMKASMETSKTNSIILNSLLTDEQRLELFMDMNSLLYSRLFTHCFTLRKDYKTDKDGVVMTTLDPFDSRYFDFVVRYIVSCLISTNETKLLEIEEEKKALRDLLSLKYDLLDILEAIDKLLKHFNVFQIDVEQIESFIYQWLDDKRNYGKMMKMFRLFVPEKNDTLGIDPSSFETPTMIMTDTIIDAFIANHPDISVNYTINAIIIEKLLNIDAMMVKVETLGSDFDELIVEGFNLVTEHLNMFTNALTIRDETFDISRLHLNPNYICHLFKLYGTTGKTNLHVVDYHENGIYDLLSFVVNVREYIQYIEIINNYIDVAEAINSEKTKLIDLSSIAYLVIELRLPIQGNIDFAITNDQEMHVFRFKDKIKFGSSIMNIDEFMNLGIIKDIEAAFINGSLFAEHIYTEDIQDAITLARFAQRNK